MKRLYLALIIALLGIVVFSCVSTDIEEVVPEPEEVQVEPVVEEVVSSIDDEYKKAISGISAGETISKDTFEEDKRNILSIIDELSIIMDNKNYVKWCGYIDPDSLAYWKKPANLAKATSRLPVKGIVLKNLEDYFAYIFIPSRKGHAVSQIRYLSEDSVKAVQVLEDESIVVYYNFIKVNNLWMVQLPKIN